MSGSQDDFEEQGVDLVSDDDIIRSLRSGKEAAEKRLADLERQLVAERSGRVQAEDEATRAATAHHDARMREVEARVAGYDTQAADLRRQLAEASREGDSDKVAEINDQLATVRGEQAIEKRYLESVKAERAQAAERVKAESGGGGGARLSQFTAAQRQWIDAHPEFMDDPALQQLTAYGHNRALSMGYKVDSPEYFDEIDRIVEAEGYRSTAQRSGGNGNGSGPTRRSQRQQQAEDFEDDPPPPRRARQSPDYGLEVSRPSSAGGGGGSGGRGRIHLTADEREAADLSMPDVPIEDTRDPRTGKIQPGRYRRYHEIQQNLKRDGQIH